MSKATYAPGRPGFWLVPSAEVQDVDDAVRRARDFLREV